MSDGTKDNGGTSEMVKCRYCGHPEHRGSGCYLPDLPKTPTGQFVLPADDEMNWRLAGRDPAKYSKCTVEGCEEPRREGHHWCTTHGQEVVPTYGTANARQVGGDHYMKQAIQPWDYIVANKIGFLAGCAIKYISRYNSPGAGGIRDLEKARHFLEKLIEVETQEIEDRGSDKL